MSRLSQDERWSGDRLVDLIRVDDGVPVDDPSCWHGYESWGHPPDLGHQAEWEIRQLPSLYRRCGVTEFGAKRAFEVCRSNREALLAAIRGSGSPPVCGSDPVGLVWERAYRRRYGPDREGR
jgi:hypothetical protein